MDNGNLDELKAFANMIDSIDNIEKEIDNTDNVIL